MGWSFSFVAQAQAGTAEEEVQSMHDQYCKAVEKKDSIFLKSLFHDRMVITSGSGVRRDKQGEIRDALDPRYLVNYFRTRDANILVSGTTAVLTGDLYWEIMNEGKPLKIERRITFTYVKEGRDWKILAQHIGRVPTETGR
jgi:ketosteroid isomerase-like protein